MRELRASPRFQRRQKGPAFYHTRCKKEGNGTMFLWQDARTAGSRVNPFRGLELPANFNPEGIGSELANQRDEELRLFYVAITRARKGLVVSYADRYSGDREMGGQIEDLPTSFMKDLPAGLFSIHSKANEPSLFAPPKIRKLPAELRGAPKMVSYSLLFDP